MNFKNLMSLKDMLTIHEDAADSDRIGTIISNALKMELIIVEGKLYKLNETNVYDPLTKSSDDTLTGAITKYLSQSFGKLTNTELQTLKLKLIEGNPNKTPDQLLKAFKMILNNTFIKRNISSIRSNLTYDITFNDDPDGIHFQNGRFNLLNNTLEERTKPCFINQYIKRDFINPKEETINWLNSKIDQLFREKEAREYCLHMLGGMLSGRVCAKQEFLVNYGQGARGKSTLYNFINAAVSDVYFQCLKNDTFSNHNNNKDKSLNSFNNYTRYYFLNEIDTRSLNTDLIKSVVDGKIQTNKLYQDGTFKTRTQGTLIFVSNHMINFKTDSGIERRLKGYEYKNEFTDDKTRVNNDTVYLKDEKLFNAEENFTDEQRNAMFYILSSQLVKENVPTIPECFTSVTDDIVDANDEWAHFIEKYLIEEKGAKVHIDYIIENVRLEYPTKKNIGRSQVLSELKDKGFNYNRKLKCPGYNGYGCFIDYKPKEKIDEPDFIDEDDDPDDHKRSIADCEKIIKQQAEEIEKLKKLLEQHQLNKLSITQEIKKEVEQKAPVEPEEIESDSDDEEEPPKVKQVPKIKPVKTKKISMRAAAVPAKEEKENKNITSTTVQASKIINPELKEKKTRNPRAKKEKTKETKETKETKKPTTIKAKTAKIGISF